MTFNPERMPAKIVFKNQPKLSDHEVDRDANERRLMLVSEIERFLVSDELFVGKDVSVEFSHKGVSSLIGFVEVGEEKYVLKIPLNPNTEGEAAFLEEWEALGVQVPHVYMEGTIADHPYILMRYIDAQTLEEAIGEGAAPEDFALEMGKTLARMHSAKTEGYGRVVEGKPEYATFGDWIHGRLAKSIEKTRTHGLLGDEHGSIDKAIDILVSYVKKQQGSSYCHGDFSPGNILATKPLTVIDPNPNYNDGIIDLGLTVMREASKGRSADEIVKGYFGDMKEYDARVLQAAILVNSYMLLPYWHDRNREKNIRNIQEYLVQTAHVLE